MAIFTTSLDSARADLARAEAAVAEWQAKADAARTEAAQLDDTAGAAILADETAAERITLRVQTLERQARAYDQAAAEAGKHVKTAHRSVLTAEAEALEKDAAGIRKRAEKQEAAVEKLRAQLEELDGGKWDRVPLQEGIDGFSEISYTGKAAGIHYEALTVQTRAQCIRFWLAHGTLPADLRDLNSEFGQVHEVSVFNSETHQLDRYGDPITEALRAAAGEPVGA